MIQKDQQTKPWRPSLAEKRIMAGLLLSRTEQERQQWLDRLGFRALEWFVGYLYATDHLYRFSRN